MLALTDWGTNTANKKAYNVLTGILSKDFYLPKDFVHARNANGRVAMGLHGYRIGIGEYGPAGDGWACPAVSGLDAAPPVGLPPAEGRRTALLSGAVHRSRAMGRTHEARRDAVWWLRILLQGRQAAAGGPRAAGRVTAIRSGHRTDGEHPAQPGTGPALSRSSSPRRSTSPTKSGRSASPRTD